MKIIMKYFGILFMCLTASLTFAQIGSGVSWMNDLESKKGQEYPTYYEIKAAGEAYWSTRDKDAKGSGYKPFMRWLEHTKHFVKDDGTIQNAFDIAQATQQFSQKSAQMVTSNWQAVGPHSFINSGSHSSGTGRVNVIKVDPNNPNIYYMGAPAGGLWKSIDAGVTWQPLTDFLLRIGVSAIEIDPNNSNIIYIGTGDDDANDSPSLGMLKSIDGGITFNTTGLDYVVPGTIPSYGTYITDIYIDPTDSNKLYIAAFDGFYKSIDGGQTVTRTLTGWIRDIKLKPGDSNTIYLAKRDRFYVSRDNGNTFTQIAFYNPSETCGRIVIGVTPANADYVYLLAVTTQMNLLGVYKSTDAGASFAVQNNTQDILENRQAFFNLALEVSPTDEDIIYTGCLNVWKSVNGGTAFSKISYWSSPSSTTYTHADIHQIRQFGNELFVCSDGGIYRSLDDAGSFTDITAGAQIGQFYTVAISKDSSAEIAGGLQDNGGYTRTGNNWYNYHGADGMESAIDPTDSNVRYGLIQHGRSLEYTLNGQSRFGNRVVPSSGRWITPLKIDATGDLYIGYEALYKFSKSQGAFQKISGDFTDLIDLVELHPTLSHVIFVSVGRTLHRSMDGGVTFNSVYTTAQTTGFVEDIQVSYGDPDTIYLITSGTSGHVMKSTDLGNTFTSINSNLPNIGKTVVVHQKNTVDDALFVGTTAGVYRLDNTSNLWQPFMTNLPNTTITDLEINANDHILTAATYGRGVWQAAVPVAKADFDLSVESIVKSSASGCSEHKVAVAIKNQGLNALSNFVIEYQVNGIILTSSHNNSLVADASVDIISPALPLIQGSNDVEVTVINSNDTYIFNNKKFIQMEVIPNAVVNDVYEFENRNFMANNNLGTMPVWERGVPAGAVLNQAGSGTGNSAYATLLNGNYQDNLIAYLSTPCYDLTQINSPVLKFDMTFITELDYDVLYLQYSTDSGTTWNVLGTSNDPNWYNNSNNQCQVCVGGQWSGNRSTMQEYSYALNALSGASNITFRFVFESDLSINDEGVVIDNFVITGTLSGTEYSEINYNLYPNPSQGLFTLDLPLSSPDSFQLAVYNIAGQRVFQKKNLDQGKHTIDLRELAKGMYLLKLKTSNQELLEKLIIQ